MLLKRCVHLEPGEEQEEEITQERNYIIAAKRQINILPPRAGVRSGRSSAASQSGSLWHRTRHVLSLTRPPASLQQPARPPGTRYRSSHLHRLRPRSTFSWTSSLQTDRYTNELDSLIKNRQNVPKYLVVSFDLEQVWFYNYRYLNILITWQN